MEQSTKDSYRMIYRYIDILLDYSSTKRVKKDVKLFERQMHSLSINGRSGFKAPFLHWKALNFTISPSSFQFFSSLLFFHSHQFIPFLSLLFLSSLDWTLTLFILTIYSKAQPHIYVYIYMSVGEYTKPPPGAIKLRHVTSVNKCVRFKHNDWGSRDYSTCYQYITGNYYVQLLHLENSSC